MKLVDYATMAVAILAIMGSVAGGIRWMVKHYLNELRPNGGSSLKDSVARLETQMEIVLGLLEKK